MILYILYRIAHLIAISLPLKAGYAIASFAADVYSHTCLRDRKILVRNISTVTGNINNPDKLNAMATDVFRNFAKYLVDFFRFSKIDKIYIDRFVSVEGAENIKWALDRGNGVIVLSAHIGNWELGAFIMSAIGYPISGVVLRHQNKKINDFFKKQRMIGNMRPIEMGGSLKACYHTLKSNGLLALLGDRDFTKNGLRMNFFGKQALIPRGPGALSYRIGSVIVPCFTVREKGDRFKLLVGKPILPDQKLDEEAAIEKITGEYLKTIEACIRAYPTQWYVFKNIWSEDAEELLRPDTII